MLASASVDRVEGSGALAVNARLSTTTPSSPEHAIPTQGGLKTNSLIPVQLAVKRTGGPEGFTVIIWLSTKTLLRYPVMVTVDLGVGANGDVT
jgi:hypothetical protein